MTPGRLIFIAMPGVTVRRLMEEAAIGRGLAAELGDAMFPVVNWHQSLSVRYEDTPSNRKTLIRAGRRVIGSAFKMTFNRVSGEIDDPEGIHWAFRTLGKPKGLVELVSAIQSALRDVGLPHAGGHTGHITISYHAPAPRKPVYIKPIDWVVDEFCLVRGGGQPYRYEVLARWPLAIGTHPASAQLSLI